MTVHHAAATTALLPIGVPRRRPRTVSMIGVKGWYSANQRRAVGMESVGTKPLPRKGRKTRGMGALLAASGVGDLRPRATDSQVMATTNRVSIAAAASHSAAVALGRKPMAR